jgi:hypothetical protein
VNAAIWSLVGALPGWLATVSWVPALRRVLRLRSATSYAWAGLALVAVAQVVSFVFYAHLGNALACTGQLVCFACCVTTCVVKWRDEGPRYVRVKINEIEEID